MRCLKGHCFAHASLFSQSKLFSEKCTISFVLGICAHIEERAGPQVVAHLLLDLMELNRGYAGAQIFGYVVLPIWPTDYNLPRIPAAQVHDFNHRVRLTYEPWTLATMVGQYIVMESLTESFAAELYGPEYIGPWMGCLTNEETACSRSI